MLKKNYRNLYVFVCTLTGIFYIFSPLIHAAENNFEKLRRESAKIKTLQADFVQKKFMKILSQPLISEGRLYYAAPDSFRWEYFKPLKSVVINHENSSKRYVYSEGKMVEDKTGGVQAMKIVLNDVANWLSGSFDQNPSFKAIIREGASIIIILTPAENTMRDMIEKIEITLSKKTATVRSVKIIEDANSSTQINFRNIQINKAINSSVFQDAQ
ncbi:MAG: outer membrane lipoprotein carrier protein LolA [Syntrophaceae bacterium]|nr:outer membrane lipoprotein carrier protein LolA [Syntrophaceae bacterium]